MYVILMLELPLDLRNLSLEFSFPAGMFIFPSGNIPIQLGYDVVYGQIQRYAEACSKQSGFLNVSRKIFATLCKKVIPEVVLLRKCYRQTHLSF